MRIDFAGANPEAEESALSSNQLTLSAKAAGSALNE
jgi:hypothetical protein